MNTQLPQSVPETQTNPMNYMYSFPMPQIPQTLVNQTFPVNTPNMYSTEMINSAIAQIYMNNMMNMQLAMMANGQYQAHTQTQVQPSTTIPINTVSIPQQNILNDTKSFSEEETKSNDSKKEKGFSYLKIDKGYLKKLHELPIRYGNVTGTISTVIPIYVQDCFAILNAEGKDDLDAFFF